MACLTAGLFHLVMMPVRYHLTYIANLDFCLDILAMSVHRTRRDMQLCRNIIRLVVPGYEPEHIHLSVSQCCIKLRAANHPFMFALAPQRTLYLLEHEQTILVDVKVVLVILPEVAADEAVYHPEFVVPAVHGADRIELHQPGMCFRISVPNDSKHVLDSWAVGVFKNHRRLPELFHHHIPFRSVVELDVSYRHELRKYCQTVLSPAA